MLSVSDKFKTEVFVNATVFEVSLSTDSSILKCRRYQQLTGGIEISGIYEFFTHRRIKERISRLERELVLLKSLLEPKKAVELRILEMLSEPKTTSEIAARIKMSRSWISEILNELERLEKVEEVGKRGRSILYRRVPEEKFKSSQM